MYAKIQNPGVCPVDRFFVLGLTTSRKDESKIGQFGSGAKHAIFTLLRSKLSVVIYSGLSRISFFTKTKLSGGHEYEQVYINIDGEEQSLNVALDFGEIDWKTSIDMAMREIVANAIDASEDIADVLISITNEEPKAYENKTTIYVEANAEVKHYIGDIDNRFLHFSRSDCGSGYIIDKDIKDKVRFYHKGVFVRFGAKNSLFDYNFGDDVKIDESRNLDHYSCGTVVAKYLSKDKNRLKTIFGELKANKDYFETSIYEYTLECCAKENHKVWQNAWYELFGNKALVTSVEDAHIAQRAVDKGYKLILITNTSWAKALICAGIKTPLSVIDDVDNEGNEILLSTSILIDNVRKVWGWLECAGLATKNQPKVAMFRQLRVDKLLMGYYKDGTIYINQECQTSLQAIFEELSHYLSDASDNTREFQNFLVEYAVRISQ